MRVFQKYFGSGLSRLSLLTVALWPVCSPAVVLDWSTVTWAAGTLSHSYDIDPSHAGNDITVSITGNTGNFVNTTPQIDSKNEGGLGAGTKALDFTMQHGNLNQNVVVTITFNYAQGVDGVSFSLFDIDTSGGNQPSFVDQIRSIRGSFGSTNYSPTITGSVDNTVAGSGTNQTITGNANAPNTGAGSGDANATISFNNTITSLTFTYGNDASSQDPPSEQSISLYNISYKPKVPEVHPGLFAAVACGVMMLLRLKSRRQSIKRAP